MSIINIIFNYNLLNIM